MKNNYPIKYANIPIYENNKQGASELVYYISVKTYVIGEHRIYNEDGSVKTHYGVVTPYYNSSCDTYKRQEPNYNLINNSCTNSYTVDKLYDSYDAAIKDKNKMIEILYLNKVARLGESKAERELFNLEFNNIQDYYEDLQFAIFRNTKDIIVGIKGKPQKIILSHKNSVEVIDESLYHVMDVYKSYTYAARTINQRDYVELNYNASRKMDVTDNIGELLLINEPDSNIIKIFTDDGYTYLKDGKLDDKMGDDILFHSNPDIIFYTFEDSFDLLKSYEKTDHEFSLKRKK